MLVRNRPTPGTPMAKSASFFSANSFTCRGVITCSANSFRSSGLSGAISRVVSSPFTRTVGARPTLSSRSEPLRWIIWAMACLKLNGAAAPAPVGSAIRIHPEKDLAVFHRLRVLDAHLPDDAGDLRLDLVHDLHRFDDADRLARRHPGPDLGVGFGSRLRCPVEGPHHGRPDFLEASGGGMGGRRATGGGLAGTGGGCRRSRHQRAGRG